MYETGRQHGSVYICSGGTDFMANIIAFPQEDRQPQTVLIVDDEPAIRGFLYDYLSQCGFNPLTAASGDEAIELLEKDITIDLVFSDVRMPGKLDGFGLAHWVMEHRPGLPVLLASGDLGKVNATRELVAEIVAKPYDFDMVVRKMHAALDHRAACSA
jgi:DNA-binding NtrC family response regulator